MEMFLKERCACQFLHQAIQFYHILFLVYNPNIKWINHRNGTVYRIEGEGSRNFKTQDEAMNYCLKVLRSR